MLSTTFAYAQDAGDFYAALKASSAVTSACPALTGVTIGVQGDRATWLGQYATTPSGPCLTAAAAVAAALTARPTTVLIASTGTPSLNAAYSINQSAQANIQAIAIYITVNGKFPLSLTAMPWYDASGAVHVFPNTATFLAFATAIGDYVTALQLGTTPPTPPLAIP